MRPEGSGKLQHARQGFDYGRWKDVPCSAKEQNVEDGDHKCQYRGGNCDLPTNRAIVCLAPRQPRRPPFVDAAGDGFRHYGGLRGDILCYDGDVEWHGYFPGKLLVRGSIRWAQSAQKATDLITRSSKAGIGCLS